MHCVDKLIWFDAQDRRGYADWEDAWARSRYRRPFDHPQYLMMMAEPATRPIMVCYGHPERGQVLYPFYRRNLKLFPFWDKLEGEFWDTVSPYGYGGPFYEGPPSHEEETVGRFNQLFSDAMIEGGCVAEFVREDVVPSMQMDRHLGDRLSQQKNIIVDLRKSIDVLKKEYSNKVRKNINRALANKLSVCFDATGQFLNQFLDVYHHTMSRNAAKDRFYFDREDLLGLNRALIGTAGLLYAHVLWEGEVISSELVLLSSGVMYSFLGGTLCQHYDKRPNDFLKHEIIKWGVENGYHLYVLGGGVGADDSLYQYKKSFAPQGETPFWTRRIIYDTNKYETLIATRRSFEIQKGLHWDPAENYFPAYLS